MSDLSETDGLAEADEDVAAARRLHRATLAFDDGLRITKLVHPAGGCQAVTICGHCHRDATDPEDDRRCASCKDGIPDGGECWVEMQVENTFADELLHGYIPVVLDVRWEGDHAEAHIVQEPSSEEPSDRDLLRALAVSTFADDLMDHDHDCEDLFDAGLVVLRGDITGEYETDLTKKGTALIRARINREEASADE